MPWASTSTGSSRAAGSSDSAPRDTARTSAPPRRPWRRSTPSSERGARTVPAPAQDSAEELFEHAPCAYVTTAADGTIGRVNRTFLSWTGYGHDALAGARRFQDLLAPGGRIYWETHVAPLLRMQDVVNEIALDVVCADGRRLPVLVNLALHRSGDGTPLGVRAALFHTSDREA